VIVLQAVRVWSF